MTVTQASPASLGSNIYSLGMDDSDNMLFASLLEMRIKLPASVTCLAEIKSEHLQDILIQMLSLAGSQTSSITQLNKTQRFRVATKLNHELTRKFNTQFQLNDLMSSNLDTVRKILVAIMSKMSMVELESKNNERAFDIADTTDAAFSMTQKKILIFDGWLKKEWVHPSLVDRADESYHGHHLHYDMGSDDFEKKNILRDVRGDLGYSLQAILSETLNRYLLATKKKDESQGFIRHQEDAFEEIKNKNREDWVQLKNNQKKMAKARKRLIANVERTSSKKTEPGPSSAPTIFQQQVQELKIQTKERQQEKEQVSTQAGMELDDPLSKLKFDLQQIKKSHEREILAMTAQLEQKQKELSQAEEERGRLEDEIVKGEEKVGQLEVVIQTTKVEAQKVKRILDGMNSPEGLEGEVNKLKEEIKEIEGEATGEISSLQKSVKQIQKSAKDKLSEISEVKQSLSRIEEDYVRITRQLADNERRKTKIQLPTQGITRAVYNKKIAQNESKLRENKQQIFRMNQEIGKLQQNIRMSITSTQRIETEIQNLLIQDSKKHEDLEQNIKSIYNKYKSIYKHTIETMRGINDAREESREYETRVRQIANKNYKETIEKLSSLK